jgi:hypothetical protein
MRPVCGRAPHPMRAQRGGCASTGIGALSPLSPGLRMCLPHCPIPIPPCASAGRRAARRQCGAAVRWVMGHPCPGAGAGGGRVEWAAGLATAKAKAHAPTARGTHAGLDETALCGGRPRPRRIGVALHQGCREGAERWGGRMAMWGGIGAGIPAAAREDGGEGPIAHVAAAGGEVAVDLVAVVNHVANRAPQAPAGCSRVTTEASTRGGENYLSVHVLVPFNTAPRSASPKSKVYGRGVLTLSTNEMVSPVDSVVFQTLSV